jgi:hypothetical protein
MGALKMPVVYGFFVHKGGSFQVFRIFAEFLSRTNGWKALKLMAEPILFPRQ